MSKLIIVNGENGGSHDVAFLVLLLKESVLCGPFLYFGHSMLQKERSHTKRLRKMKAHLNVYACGEYDQIGGIIVKKNFFSSKLAVILSLIIVLVSSLVAHSVQTNFGSVTVKDVRFVGNNGNLLSAKLFTPTGMNPQEKQPAILTMHGYINTREVQDSFNIEFARRGYVVLAMDMQGHGYSEQEPVEVTSRGAIAGLTYLRGLGFVDQEKIAVEGHSMGGWSTLAAATTNPEWIHTVIQVGSSTETYGAGEVTADTEFNYAIVFGKYDEFAKLMWEVPQAKQIADTDKIKKVFGTEESVTPKQLYGSFEDQSARTLYIPNETHPSNH
ncbi:alpha/beta hydrolase family protein [Bacillus sp. DJP31]|uniref:alpha/beta hydrolase family protein n=1 Tax=Bacillus sp. DJP31 TaxID=3409789 RepID=UPI003BB63BE7